MNPNLKWLDPRINYLMWPPYIALVVVLTAWLLQFMPPTEFTLSCGIDGKRGTIGCSDMYLKMDTGPNDNRAELNTR